MFKIVRNRQGELDQALNQSFHDHNFDLIIGCLKDQQFCDNTIINCLNSVCENKNDQHVRGLHIKKVKNNYKKI